jgi:alpha-N-arabinofuranosidase
LRLKGSKFSFKEKDSPAFVARRQTAFDMVASTKVSFTPMASNEEAGLIVRGDDNNHFDLVITMRDGKRVVLLRKYLQGKEAEIQFKEILEGDMVLRISTTGLEYSFWVQQKDMKPVLIGTAKSKDLSTEEIGGFTGTYLGMYASGNGLANTNPADFDWFEYKDAEIVANLESTKGLRN